MGKLKRKLVSLFPIRSCDIEQRVWKVKTMKCIFLFQQNVFPDQGSVYDYFFVKQASGSWGKWMDYVDKKKLGILKDAKVYHVGNNTLR